EAKAKMEMLLLRRWREELALENVSVYSAFKTISRNDRTGKSLRQLQDWLHRPASTVRREDIAAVLKPYAAVSSSPNPASVSAASP
ncbi:MAG TPA: hypothetical protein VLE43_14380, partial [Candidatus Saccharimonadia bacterium]|nr:hypothetical protein [Candidatus Saccharimonadia bacterium]